MLNEYFKINFFKSSIEIFVSKSLKQLGIKFKIILYPLLKPTFLCNLKGFTYGFSISYYILLEVHIMYNQI